MSAYLFGTRWALIEQADCWRQAIHLACRPLIEQGIVDTRYPEAIINSVIKHGAYFILSPGFALPHARPEEGVIMRGVHYSLLKLRQPVVFPGGDAVTLLIALAASDGGRHIEAISRLLSWLETDRRLAALLAITEPNALADMLASSSPSP